MITKFHQHLTKYISGCNRVLIFDNGVKYFRAYLSGAWHEWLVQLSFSLDSLGKTIMWKFTNHCRIRSISHKFCSQIYFVLTLSLVIATGNSCHALTNSCHYANIIVTGTTEVTSWPLLVLSVTPLYAVISGPWGWSVMLLFDMYITIKGICSILPS